MSRWNIPQEFKAEAVQLVVSKGYSFAQASEARDMADTAGPLGSAMAHRAGKAAARDAGN